MVLTEEQKVKIEKLFQEALLGLTVTDGIDALGRAMIAVVHGLVDNQKTTRDKMVVLYRSLDLMDTSYRRMIIELGKIADKVTRREPPHV